MTKTITGDMVQDYLRKEGITEADLQNRGHLQRFRAFLASVPDDVPRNTAFIRATREEIEQRIGREAMEEALREMVQRGENPADYLDGDVTIRGGR